MNSITDKLKALGIAPMDGSRFEPLAQTQIDEIEQTIRTALPPEYAHFLREFGRSMFSMEVNCTPSKKPLYFGWFYGYDELIASAESHREVLPETVIPIGDDGGGNQFCLGVSGADAGKVFFHNHSIGWHADAEAYLQRGEAIPSGIRHETVHEIARSFGEFVSNMERDEEGS
jgi:hypothetical protein